MVYRVARAPGTSALRLAVLLAEIARAVAASCYVSLASFAVCALALLLTRILPIQVQLTLRGDRNEQATPSAT